jgi:hypothetical protein
MNDDTEQRKMNDTTMPPPPASSRRPQQPPTAVSSGAAVTTVADTTTTAAAAVGTSVTSSTVLAPPPVLPRRKVVVPNLKGTGRGGRRFGLSDWTRLLATANDLAQRKGQAIRSNISWSEIQQHCTVHDGWTVIKNKVYHLSPYLVYHPGGESILKSVLGKDATILFNKYHRWVNEDGYVCYLYVCLYERTNERTK